MNRPIVMLISGLILVILRMPTADAWNNQYQQLRVANADQLIFAMRTAADSGKPTQIRLAQGDYVLTRFFGTGTRTSHLPVVFTTIQIIGSNASKTRLIGSPDTANRIFLVARGGNLSLYKLTVTGGLELCSSSDGADCRNDGGGAALNVGGNLEFHECVITGNGAFRMDGLQPFGGGGAILNLAGHILLDRSSVTGNSTQFTGAGVLFLGGSGDILRSIVSGNQLGYGAYKLPFASGSGILVGADASLSISASTISGNAGGPTFFLGSVSSGLGLYNSGKTTLIDSAVMENFDQSDASLLDTSAGAGGGIFNNGTLRIVNSTVGGNVIGTLGGGIYNSGKLTLQGVTIKDNQVLGAHGFYLPDVGGFPDGCTLMNQAACVTGGAGIWNDPPGVVSVSTSAIGDNEAEDCNGVLTSYGHNAVGNSLNCTLKRSAWLGPHPSYDHLNLDLRLGDLQDDGTPGAAHYTPLADSPLIDAGGPVGPTCARLDQIGQSRVEGDDDNDGTWKCDIGAIEYQPPKTQPAQSSGP